MKVRAIKTNYLLSVIRIFATAIIGVVTMPFINKTLGAENLGKIEYVNTIINYFLLFSGLGIPIYGIREIAKIRDNKELRNKVVVELLLILGITTMISYLILFGFLYQLNFFKNYQDLLLIMSSMIILTNIGAEWFFQGMEDQLYITIRFLIVRFIGLFLLYYFVKSATDYLFYAFILVLTLAGSNIYNFFYLFKIIDTKAVRIKDLDFKRHLKPIFSVFIAAISVNIYLQLDIFLIGSIAGDKYVGYYAVSNKLIRFVIVFITVIGAVLLPRLTYLYQNNNPDYFGYLKKAFNYILIISLPFCVFFYIYSANIIELFAGKDYAPSVLTMQILSPLCTIVGIAYFLGYLLLYPQNKEIIYTKAVMFSAIFSLLVNYFMIKLYLQNGAAVIAVASELLAILIMLYMSKEDIKKLNLIDWNIFKILSATAITFFVSFFLQAQLTSVGDFHLVFIYSFLNFLLFYTVLKILNETTINDLLKELKIIAVNYYK